MDVFNCFFKQSGKSVFNDYDFSLKHDVAFKMAVGKKNKFVVLLLVSSFDVCGSDFHLAFNWNLK
jgi:hypothetical protein